MIMIEEKSLIDGVDIKDYSAKELRNSVGLVLQDPFLYHGTVESILKCIMKN